MTKSSFIIVGGFILVALLLGAGVALRQREQTMPQAKTPPQISSQTQLQPPLAGWKTYRNEKYGFEVKYPQDWKVLKSDNEELEITYLQYILTISVLDFRETVKGIERPSSFQDWIDEHPYNLVKFHDRDALRWYTRGIPTPTPDNRGRFYGTETFIIPSQKYDFAVEIYMVAEDIRTCDSCVEIFNHLARSFSLGGKK